LPQSRIAVVDEAQPAATGAGYGLGHAATRSRLMKTQVLTASRCAQMPIES